MEKLFERIVKIESEMDSCRSGLMGFTSDNTDRIEVLEDNVRQIRYAMDEVISALKLIANELSEK